MNKDKCKDKWLSLGLLDYLSEPQQEELALLLESVALLLLKKKISESHLLFAATSLLYRNKVECTADKLVENFENFINLFNLKDISSSFEAEKMLCYKFVDVFTYKTLN